MKVNVKNTFATVLVALLSFFTMAFSPAEKPAKNDLNVEVKYYGSSNDFLNFEVAVRQEANHRVILVIKDGFGQELFRDYIGRSSFSKFVKVARNDFSRLQFVVNSPNGQYKKAFSIQSEVLENVHVTEDIK